jgi:queuine tRNA-ribosyltransferase
MARIGEFNTLHGNVQTPVFLPVGSQGTVKTLVPEELREIGVSMILANAYHLYLRPGTEIIEQFGGLHNFMKWDKPILTDSGGYQVFSLSPLRKITENGVIFRSHIDGSEHQFTPESVIDLQEKIGGDIIMTLDECSSPDDTIGKVKEAMFRTHSWAQRSLKAHHDNGQLLFGIVQGGVFPDLRRQSATTLTDMDFPGYAIGGLSLGETKNLTWDTAKLTLELLPNNKPRYLMGVGSPEDIVEGIDNGIDIFDCALPTRVARNGALFTTKGRQNIDKSVFKTKEGPIDDSCDCYTCRTFSTAYLHHLFKSEELLAYRLATIHNLRFISGLIQKATTAITCDKFNIFKKEFISNYKTTNEKARISQKQQWLCRQRSNE